MEREIGESTRIMGDFNNYQKWIDMTGIKSVNTELLIIILFISLLLI